jgi:hypothetical protein
VRPGPSGPGAGPATASDDLDKELVGAPVDIAPTSLVTRPSGPVDARLLPSIVVR